MRLIIFCVCFSLFISAALFAQSIPASGWRHFSNTTTPRCMIADGQFLWIGTDGGLIKFDRTSNTFEILTTDNSGLPDNAIFRLVLGKDGALWVSTNNGGIARLSAGKWTIFNQSNSPLPGSSGGIPACDSLGRIWIATWNGLLKFDNGTWTKYDMSNSPMCDTTIEAVTADRNGNIWVGCHYTPAPRTRGFILKFDGASKWEIHNDTLDGVFHGDTLYYELDPENPWSMLIDHNGVLFVGFNGVINRLVPGVGWYWYDVPTGYNSNAIFTLSETAGYIWGADEVDAVRINDTLSQYTDIEQHPWKKNGTGFPFFGTCAALPIGDELWFAGNGGGGIGRFKDSAWTLFCNLSDNTLTTNDMGAITQDSKGRMWFVSQHFVNGSLSAFNGKNWQNYDSVLHGSQVFSLCADSSGNVWIGTEGNGLIKFDGVTAETFDLNKLLNFSNEISALAFDKRGVLWIGTQLQGNTGLPSGLVKFDGSNWKTFTQSNSSLPEGEVSSISIDKNGTTWTATPFSGIAEFDGSGIWHVFDDKNSALPSHQITGITTASNGDVWAATGKGAAKWTGTEWKAFTAGPLAGLSGCAAGSRGNIWFSSYIGNPGGASEFDGTTWKNFTLTNSAIGSDEVWAVAADDSGNIWFGTNDRGLAVFTPDAVHSSVTFLGNTSGNATGVSIYPNPALSTVHCKISFEDQNAIVEVCDLLGRNMLSFKTENPKDFSFDASMLPDGAYEIICKAGDGIIHGRFIKLDKN